MHLPTASFDQRTGPVLSRPSGTAQSPARGRCGLADRRRIEVERIRLIRAKGEIATHGRRERHG